MSKNILKCVFWPKNLEKCSILYVELKMSAILNIQNISIISRKFFSFSYENAWKVLIFFFVRFTKKSKNFFYNGLKNFAIGKKTLLPPILCLWFDR